MNGKEYLCEKLTKEQMAEHLVYAFCPKEFGFETEYSSNKERCNYEYAGDCEKCWNSKVINKV